MVLTGQSLGAYAALRAAARFPDLFSRLVLIDGGLPLPIPAGVEPDAILEATVGPAVARLKMTFDSAQLVPDCNHYTILTGPQPARMIAQALTSTP